MATLGDMKSRIADELARDDLTSQIALAIDTAIDAYIDRRWFFNENRNLTFFTQAGQEFYDETYAAGIGNIEEIDSVFLLINNNSFRVTERDDDRLEFLSLNGTFLGQPFDFSWLNRVLRFSPIPTQTGWTIRVRGAMTVPGPATDTEANNPWMTFAERLIRNRAKLELMVHVIRDQDNAAPIAQAVQEAESQLTARSNKRRKTGIGLVRPMAF